MKNYYILHLGIGNVGRELVNQIEKSAKRIEKDFGVKLIYCGLFSSKGGIFAKNGLQVAKALEKLKKNTGLNRVTVEKAISEISKPFILIDTTTSDSTLPFLTRALKKGGFVVISNKRPLTQSQRDFANLVLTGGHNLFYETVVGAGLPVMHTIKTLFDTGDEVMEIQGCFSGTLGFIFSELDRGTRFSQAVIKAKQMGFTESDPREDLSGKDVARKALILARLLGLRMEMNDIHLTGLYPKEMQNLSVDEFLIQFTALDNKYKEKVEKAAKENKVLRFVAKVSKTDCSVGLKAVDKDSDIGKLKGPDNLIVIKTKRYNDIPMIIKGPGAGIEVTAAGLFGDIIHIIRKKVI